MCLHVCMRVCTQTKAHWHTRARTDAARVLGQEAEQPQALRCVGHALGQAELQEILCDVFGRKERRVLFAMVWMRLHFVHVFRVFRTTSTPLRCSAISALSVGGREEEAGGGGGGSAVAVEPRGRRRRQAHARRLSRAFSRGCERTHGNE